jgi:hypothetical protein
MCELMQNNVQKKFHMNYYVKIMHINWNYDWNIIKLWNSTIKQFTKLNQ